MKRFLLDLKVKMQDEKVLFPNDISLKNYHKIKSFIDFDNAYTAPLNGFKNSDNYCEKASSKPFIPSISIPTLIVNAKNDPFLSDSCYPIKECKNNENVFLEMPEDRGYISFAQRGDIYYSEQRTLSFFFSIK